MASAIHRHRSAIGILTSTPQWKTFNAGILCSQSFPCSSGHNIPLSPQQDRRFCLFSNFLSLYEWESVIPFKSRALRIVLVPQSHPTLQPYGLQPTRLLVHGDLQARILECVAIYFSSLENGFSSIPSSCQRSFTKEPA